MFGISKLNENSTAIFTKNSEKDLGLGSGIILSSDGYILTNYAVSGEVKSTCYVTLRNGSKYPAEVKWVNKELDIALIKVSVNNLLALSLGDSDKISIGEEIYMVSNITGYDFKEEFRSGIVSKLRTTLKLQEGEEINYAEDVLQINIDIKPENTGSPILNKNGEVLGIASSKLNYVIPINRIKNILNRFKEDEEFEEAFLGIYGFDNDVLKYLNSEYTSNLGVYIEKIDNDSPVFEKILVSDIITMIDDVELTSMQDLSEYLYTKNVGDKVRIQGLRGSKVIDIECNLKRKK